MRKSRPVSINKLIELFVASVTTRTASELVNVNKNVADYYFHRSRLLIDQTNLHLEMFEEQIKVDKSYFGGARKSKQGRATERVSVFFGLLKRNGKVYTVIVPKILNQQRYYQSAR